MQLQGPGCGRLFKPSLIVASGRILLGKGEQSERAPFSLPPPLGGDAR